MKRLFLLLAAWAWLPGAQAAAECVNGQAAGFACHRVDLLGRLSVAQLGGSAGERLNDIWGWTAPNGEEYALVGMSDGTAFVRLGADGTPELVGRLAHSEGKASVEKVSAKSCHDDACGEASAWRDIKVYGNYAFIVSEGERHGVQVFDLTRLLAVSGVEHWAEADAHYGGVGHAHNIFINEESARAYAVGNGPVRSTNDGGLHVLDISDPLAPAVLADVDGDGYTHDVQCVIYDGPDAEFLGDEICFASNEDTVTIWEVNDPANPVMLSRTGYAGAGYVHQGWLSADARYFFFNDELDEQRTGTRTRLRVLDVSSLRAPQLAAEYLSSALAIDHNNYVHDRWLLQTNYAAGLRVLDVLDPLHPVEAAYFDTHPMDVADFVGTWSNYRFPGSGIVVLSDIHSGLFVVRPRIEESGGADLSVELSVAGTAITTGERGTADVRLGAAGAADDVLLTAHLPDGARFIAVTPPSGWQCSVPRHVVECRAAAVTEGEFEFAFEYTADQPGDIDMIASAYAAAADPAPADNRAVATVRASQASGNGGGGSGGGGGEALWLAALLTLLPRRKKNH